MRIAWALTQPEADVVDTEAIAGVHYSSVHAISITNVNGPTIGLGSCDSFVSGVEHSSVGVTAARDEQAILAAGIDKRIVV
jgi:hypothetical protein